MLLGWHYLGICFSLLLVIGVGAYSAHIVQNSEDFETGGNKASSLTVAGAIIGTLVGGSSTIGTAQLAYTYGLSAWWFTLGSGISCLLLALFYVKPYRRSRYPTVVGIIREEYGKGVALCASILSVIGIFIALLPQLIAATAIWEFILPSTEKSTKIVLTAVLMLVYVVFGGVLSAGMEGVLKLTLLYITMIACGIMSLHLSGGIERIYGQLDHTVYLNLFARGFGTDAGAALSLIVGVLCTQSYAQALRAGRSDTASRGGAILSAFLIPPIGAGGILVGLYMRTCFPNLHSPKLALPLFVLSHMPPLFAGIILATLLITLIGAGAGLSLGINTIIRNDILKQLKNQNGRKYDSLMVSRVIIVGILTIACLICVGPMGDMILSYSFLSMGFRGAAVFVPLVCAMRIPGKIDSKWAMAAVLIGPLPVFVFGVWKCISFDPLFLGIGLSSLLCVAGYFFSKKRH